ncbi:hypothetical protein EYF80_003052 [Liparis tanakae]|uniref:Uncharacterized protein n=1 Tax=Liparis tanakae TaxID=230148 RepID=A0A4Z2J9W9_9TELE|nr:hypothetical protein EYF80_003052 [Liparis tanakae]
MAEKKGDGGGEDRDSSVSSLSSSVRLSGQKAALPIGQEKVTLTGTRTLLEVDPEEVEEVLRVTAVVLLFTSRPGERCRSSKRRPITGV